MTTRLKWLMATSIACLGSTAASAEEQDAARPEIVVTGHRAAALTVPAATGSRLGLTPLETPASVSSVDNDTIRARGDLTVTDAVTRLPGITTNANPGNGGTALVSRGFGGQGSVLQLYDGIRLFPVAGTITFPVDPWTVDRIEVLTGPASVLYGQGGIGGAINVITRKATDAPVYDAQLAYGSQSTLQVAAGAGGPVAPALSYRADASYRRSDGFVDRGQSHSLALSGELRFAPGGGLAVSLRDDYGDQRPQRYFGTPLIAGQLVDANRRRNYNVADAGLHYRDNRTALTIDWAIADGLSLTNATYRLTSKRLFKDLESYFYNAGTKLVDRFDNLGIVHDQTQYGDQASVKFSRKIGGMSNDFVAGFDVNDIALTYSNDFGSDAQEDSVNPYTFAPGSFFDTQGIAPRFRTKTLEYSLFAEDRLALSERISLVAGVRAENDRVRRWTIAMTGDVKVLDKTLSDTTYRVGAVYRPLPTLSFYGQYATGVDPLGTLTTFSPGQAQFRNTIGNQIEAGAKYSFLAGHGAATFAAYRIVKEHLLVQNPANLKDTTPLQVGQRSAKGLEASLAIDLAAGFGVDGNATVLDAQYDIFNAGGVSYAGKTPPNIPETAANLWLRWAAHRIDVRAGVRYVGRTFSDNANIFRVPAYAVVDGGVTFAVTHALALDLRISNLLDKAYASTTYNDEQWLLGRPRSVDVTLRAHL